MPAPSRAKAVAVLGTASDVGKTLLVAAFCRLLHRGGIRVAPFKAQNMSNNAFVTPEGGEIGRAQALQAQACHLDPHVDMNPILLKPESDACSQVVVHGRVWGKSGTDSYFTRTGEFLRLAQESYARLAQQYQAVVIEGAGSAAEVNLRYCDFVNWPMVSYADAPVVLVADIDRGGVFAQVLGTLDLLSPEDRRRVIGIVVNKFRGQPALFADGRAFLEARAGIPILGVLPYLRDLRLDQEDSLDVGGRQTPFAPDAVNIAVVLLPRMSNFTDFNALAAEPGVALRYAAGPEDLSGADAVILPGSKNTIGDLRYLFEAGMAKAIRAHLEKGCEVVGLCGGYQMLGSAIEDPLGVESGGSSPGLHLLDVTTVLGAAKITTLVEATALHLDIRTPARVKGYRMHMGVTTRGGARPCFHIRNDHTAPSDAHNAVDGGVNDNGLVWGTYIHGVFDEPEFRAAWLNRLRIRKGLRPMDTAVSKKTSDTLRHELDRWADHVEQYLDLRPVWSALNQGAR